MNQYLNDASAAPSSALPSTEADAGFRLIDKAAAGLRAYLIIGLLALMATLPGVFSMPPLDRDESRFAQATTQMLETGDFVQIRYGDTARNKKPVGIYWLQALSVEVISSPLAREIWAYRLPSVLGALIAALSAFWAGTALLPRRAAFVGAALFAVCVVAGTEGMIAKTDAMLCGMITFAMACLAHLYVGKGGRKTGILFWAALAIGALIKGPVAPLVTGMAVLAIAFIGKRKDWLKPLGFWPGPLIAILIIAPWYIAIQQATGGAFLREAIGGDLAPKMRGGQEGHFAPPGSHLLLLPLLGFPFVLGVPYALAAAFGAVKRSAKTADQQGSDRSALRDAALFLLAWAVPTWILFELLPTKLAHYTLPAYPALALMAGWALTRDTSDRPLGRVIGKGLFVFGATLIFGAVGYFGALYGGRESTAVYNGAVLAVLGGVLSLRGLGMNREVTPQHTIIWAVMIALVWHVATREGLAPRAKDLWVSPRVSQALVDVGLHPRLSIGEPGPLVTIGYPEPSLVFLTRSDTVVASPEAAIAGAKADSGAVISASELPKFQDAIAKRGLEMMPLARVSGHNYSNGDPVDLVIGKLTRLPNLGDDVRTAGAKP